jgi:K+-transporting ATPase ATPase C chain
MSLRTASRQYWVSIRAMLIFTVVLGVGYTAVITGIGQVALPAQANGSLATADGEIVGSSLIGQSFTDAEGAPLPEWFQSRPSAAGDGYDGAASSGSNYGPESEDLVTAIEDRKGVIVELDGVDPEDIPADAVTASGSGLDPHISPEYAQQQVARVAEASGVSESDVQELVDSAVQGRTLGYLGESTVNVLELNIGLAELKGK